MEKVIIFTVNSIHSFAIPFSYEAMDALLNAKRVGVTNSTSVLVVEKLEQEPLDVRVMLQSQIAKETQKIDIQDPIQADPLDEFEAIPPVPLPVPRAPSLTPVAPEKPDLPWVEPPPFDDDIPF